MTATIVFFLIGALVGLAVVLLISEWWSTASAEFDERMRDGLADIDFDRWERGL